MKFTIPGKPRGKQRPRICRINSRNVTYTPRQTTEYEKLVRASYTGVSKMFFDKNIPLEISIIALFSVPQSISKRLKNSMLKGDILPTKKPDSDNIIKIILDALNGVCYHDDSQICKIYFEKKYSEIPKVEITIKEIVLWKQQRFIMMKKKFIVAIAM